jgi:hypothetical protein
MLDQKKDIDMCKFLSFVSRRDGKRFYTDWSLRQKENFSDHCDSHSWLAERFKNDSGSPHDEDKLNKWEWNPLTQVLTPDSIVFEESESEVRAWCEALDFKAIIEPLIIKPIVNPLIVKRKREKPTEQELQWLKQWASVLDSVGDSVRASVWDSVGDSVGDFVRDSVLASVRDSVRASLRASVLDSVWASVLDSVWDSVWAYTSTFFDINYTYDFSSCAKLWEAGLVPSFDGTTWRLHAGEKAKIVWSGTPL